MLQQPQNYLHNPYHTPVMLQECMEGLAINPEGTYIDLTFGGGSHSAALLSLLGGGGRLIAFDTDGQAQKNAIDDQRFILIKDNYRNLKSNLKLYRAMNADGILADLGISSHQIDDAQRGFSTRYDAPLDLRMDTTAGLSAADIVNNYDTDELKRVFRDYGELPQASAIAKRIEKQREQKPLMTTFELKEALCSFAKPGRENKFYAVVFQALRIEVNDELGALNSMLEQCAEVLRQGGRLCVMSYHSLEDRLVKNYMRAGNSSGEVEKDFYGNSLCPYKVITKKPIIASQEEIAQNSRARSAKLRIAEKL
jgi:S-adenosyl-methyltransferase MraW